MAAIRSLLLIFLFVPAVALAQKVPGYLGKRFSLEYNAYLFPSFHNPNSPEPPDDLTGSLEQPGVSLNLQHHIVGQWSFSKRSSLVGTVGIVNTNYLPEVNGQFGFIFDEYPSMSALSFDVGMRIFFQHYAPLGRYFEFRVGFAQVSNDDFNYQGLSNSGGFPDTTDFTITGGSRTLPTVAIAWGVNRVFKDRFILSYGVDVKFFPGGFGYYVGTLPKADGNNFFFSDGNSSSNQDELLKMASARYAMHCFLNLRLGVGILL